MKLTKSQLKEIIREELIKLSESLDPKADANQKQEWLNQLAKMYKVFKPKRLDDSNLKKDVENLLSQNLNWKEFTQKFGELYSTVTTRSDWKTGASAITQKLATLWNHDQDIRKGDTSRWPYRVNTKRK